MNQKLWTDAELDLFGSEMTDEQIAHCTGRSLDAVRLKKSRQSDACFKAEPWSTTDLKYFVRSYGIIPVREIAENMGRSIASLYQRASELKLTRPHRKVNHGNQH